MISFLSYEKYIKNIRKQDYFNKNNIQMKICVRETVVEILKYC